MSATVRDNILFSHEYDEVFYNLVIEGDFIPAAWTKIWPRDQHVLLAKIWHSFLKVIWRK